MDLTLNNLQELIFLKNQPTNQLKKKNRVIWEFENQILLNRKEMDKKS